MRTLYEVKKGLVLVAAIVASIGFFACGGGGGGGETADDSSTDIIGTAPSTNCSMIAFQVGSESKAVINETVTPATITVTAPYGVDKTNAVATFTLGSATATVSVGGTAQVSGTTSNNFSSAVSYIVTAADGITTREYVVTLNVLPEEKLLITEYYEGSSNNKYLEITNTSTTDDIDLSEYTLVQYNHNSSNVPGSEFEGALFGVLKPGKSVVYVNNAYTSGTLTVVAGLPAYSVGITSSWKQLATKDNAGLINNAAGYVTGDTTVVVDGFADSAGPVGIGDTFTIAGETGTPKHTVTGTVQTSGNTTSITFTPALVSDIADNAAVNVDYNAANKICSFNGNDPVSLKHFGILVDRVGPTDHTNFGAEVIMVRKPAIAPNKTYTVNEWSICSIGAGTLSGDDYNAGSYFDAASGNVLKFFTLNNVRATISGTAVSLSLPAGTVMTSLVPYFHSDAATVSVGATAQTSGSSVVDFSTTSTPQASPAGTNYTKTYTVATGGTTQDYTVTIFVPTPQVYTTTNYDFDGNIDDALAVATSSTAANIDTVSGGDVTITGIVTGILHSGQIYIQDQNAAIAVYKSSAFSSVNVGDKITLTGCTQSKLFNGLAEISNFNSGTYTLTVNSTGNAIFYTDSTNWSADKSLKVYCYYGSVQSAASTSSPYAGEFSTAQAFRSNNATNAALFTSDLQNKYFFGVIDVYSNTSRMLLTSLDQVRNSK